jgi:hypothetical protein
MAQLRDGAGLALEALRDFLILAQMTVDDLDSDFTPQALVAGAVDRSHAAMTDLLDQLVFLELRA